MDVAMAAGESWKDLLRLTISFGVLLHVYYPTAHAKRNERQIVNAAGPTMTIAPQALVVVIYSRSNGQSSSRNNNNNKSSCGSNCNSSSGDFARSPVEPTTAAFKRTARQPTDRQTN